MQADQPVATRGPRVELDPFYTSSPFEPRLDPPTTLDEIDLTDGGLMQFGDPHAAWRLLREQAPVYWHAKPAAGVSEVHRKADLYSLSESIFIDLLPDNVPHQLTSMDPPEHTAHRKAINRYFTATAVQRWGEDIRAITNTVLDGAAQADGPINFHEAIAAPVPFLATCGLLEMPPERAQELAVALTSMNYASLEDFDRFTETLISFFDTLTREIEPREDGLISALFNADIDGKPIDRAAALAQLWILFVGAIDTTAHATSIGMLSLFHHPHQFDRLKADLSLMPSAVTELLRRFPNIEQAGQPERGEAFTMILSPLEQLPVRLGKEYTS